MKTGNNLLRNFFVKEPKFSILIVLIAIIMLVTLYFTVDLNTLTAFSIVEKAMPKLSIATELFDKHIHIMQYLPAY
ncbi:hypothetical protein PZB74_01740 [Porifericola rhodea]|uniref:hypothetical protein n=1 Tax=Porifericola rhodea TaxID=930972 RepID=UPI002666F14B|nr:hypothetical protein [Porifericola rhodea]WKN32075.1 hypothetical protein PZB74_01740 [Porifericola rhodea]